MEASCRRVRWRRADVEAWRYGRKRYGALEARCRCSSVVVWRYGVLESRCRRVDVEAWRYGARRRVAVTLQACRRGGMEVGRSGDALLSCRRGSIEVWSSGALEA